MNNCLASNPVRSIVRVPTNRNVPVLDQTSLTGVIRETTDFSGPQKWFHVYRHWRYNRGKMVGDKDATNGIAQHVYETSHIINWKKVELIESHKYQ